MTLEGAMVTADATLAAAAAAGIDLDVVAARLERQAVEGFVAAYDRSLLLIAQHRRRLLA